MKKAIPVEKRFWAMVDKRSSDECWEWQGTINWGGYGRLLLRNKQVWFAHRVSWMIHNGNIPDGLCVLHKCDNRKCVNPKHLFLGTKQDNSDDMMQKGRLPSTAGELNGRHKLTWEVVQTIRNSYKPGMKYSEMAKVYKVTPEEISNVIRNLKWKGE